MLGLFKEWECAFGECRLCGGDTLLLYTDGITESFNAAGEEFGEERLIQTLREHHELTSCDLLQAIVNEVKKFSPQEQFDDITLIVAKCGGK